MRRCYLARQYFTVAPFDSGVDYTIFGSGVWLKIYSHAQAFVEAPLIV